MASPLISLLMMVKDEAATLGKVLETAAPFIDRYTIIVDEATTDDTVAIIQAVLKDKPGNVYLRTWEGYAQTRNRCIEFDEAAPDRAVFSLFLSGDEYLRDGKQLREHLEAHREVNAIDAALPLIDCHFVCVYTAAEEEMTPQGRVFRVGSDWHYEDGDCGVHEFPAHPKGDQALITSAPYVSIDHIPSDVERRYASIEEHHIPLLEGALDRNPKNARALMLIAQSYEALFPFFPEEVRVSYAMLAASFYIRRTALPGTPEELNYARMKYYDATRIAGVYTAPELYGRLEALQQQDPRRPEIALMVLEAALRKLPMPEAYEVACRAVQVAEAARGGIGNTSTVSTSAEWKAHRYAAMIARQLVAKGQDRETWAKRVKEHVSAGMNAGGEWAAFKPLTEPFKKPEPTPETPPDAPQAA